MIKTRLIKVKSIENEEIIMAMTMTKIIITTVIMKIIIITMMIMRIEIGNQIKIVHVKRIHISLKGKIFQKAMFCWNAKIT